MKIKNLNHCHSSEKLLTTCKGFSLVELLLMVSIVALLSVSSVVGFGRLKQVLLLRESASFLMDFVKQQELKVLRGDFEKSVITFLPHYLVVEEYVEGADLSLKLIDSSECNANDTADHGVKLLDEGELAQWGPSGIIQTRQLALGKVDCETDFELSEFRELSYQLKNGDRFSNIIRFVHFNLKRDPIENLVTIGPGDQAKIEIDSPYGKKTFYRSDSSVSDGLIITLNEVSTGTLETLTLQ